MRAIYYDYAKFLTHLTKIIQFGLLLQTKLLNESEAKRVASRLAAAGAKNKLRPRA